LKRLSCSTFLTATVSPVSTSVACTARALRQDGSPAPYAHLHISLEADELAQGVAHGSISTPAPAHALARHSDGRIAPVGHAQPTRHSAPPARLAFIHPAQVPARVYRGRGTQHAGSARHTPRSGGPGGPERPLRTSHCRSPSRSPAGPCGPAQPAPWTRQHTHAPHLRRHTAAPCGASPQRLPSARPRRRHAADACATDPACNRPWHRPFPLALHLSLTSSILASGLQLLAQRRAPRAACCTLAPSRPPPRWVSCLQVKTSVPRTRYPF